MYDTDIAGKLRENLAYIRQSAVRKQAAFLKTRILDTRRFLSNENTKHKINAAILLIFYAKNVNLFDLINRLEHARIIYALMRTEKYINIRAK